jgi:HAD superfamily hydrolase (TIGR01509 family)
VADTMRTIDVLLFDLGGVLVEFSGIEGLRVLLRTAADDEAIRKRLVACPLVQQFEIGALAPLAFAEQFVAQWDLVVPPETFLAEFRSWSRSLLPGARELLQSLRPRYRLAALSNSNVVHWDRNTAELGVTGLFDAAYSSHLLGLRKPDPAIYREALTRLGVPAERVMFFDDYAPNVEGATAEGMIAFHVRGVEELSDCLRKQGLFPHA